MAKTKEDIAVLAQQLCWSHFQELLPVKSDEARIYYAQDALNRRLGTKELRRQISRKAYERREIANAELTEQSAVPFNVFKDPYLLDVLGLRENFLEADLEKAVLIENEPIGLILCTKASRSQIELLELDKSGIAVAEYWTNLPPKAALEEKIQSIISEAQERLSRRKSLSISNGEKQIDYFYESKDYDED